MTPGPDEVTQKADSLVAIRPIRAGLSIKAKNVVKSVVILYFCSDDEGLYFEMHKQNS